MQENNALVLEIFRQSDSLKMSVFERSQIASTLRHYSQLNVSFTEVESFCQETASLLAKANKIGVNAQELVKGLMKTGQLLWDHLLTRQVRDKLKSTQVTDLILSLDETLIRIPWELIFDGGNFLCLNFNLGRLVRTETEITPVHYRSWTATPRMLILADPTSDLKGAYLEGVNIKNQFDRKRNEVHIDFKSTRIDKLYVKKNLCDYDIVHFAGHCEYEPKDPGRSGWVLEDGRFTVSEIMAMGQTVSLPDLIFSNACYSANAFLESRESAYQETNYSLAQAFLFSGVRHYIGSIRRIEDPVSLAFSKEFYSQLLKGYSVGESIRQARLSLIKTYGVTSLHWASHLLYGDPSFTLFRPRVMPQPHRIRRKILSIKKQIARVAMVLAAIAVCAYLYIWLPSLNPSTFLLFSRSKQLFLKGANDQVIQSARRIIEKDPLFLQAYPLLADTFRRMGDRENALKYYFDYAMASEKKHDQKNLSSAYLSIGWFYHLDGEYAKAFDFYQKALVLSRSNHDKLNEADALGKLAVWYVDKKDYAQSLELLTKSSEINRQRQRIYKHRYNLACDYFNLGLVFINKDDFATAKEFYDRSFKLFKKLNLTYELSDYYFNIGEIYSFEKEYQKALDCYMQGLSIDRAQGNKPSLASDYNMIGELYLEIDNLKQAEEYFRQALKLSGEINARPELASAYFNLGVLEKRMNRKSRAREYFRQAQEIYRKIDITGYDEVKDELFAMDR